MFRISIAMFALSLLGCAAQRPKAAIERPVYMDAPSVAVVFDAPVCLDQPPVNLPREPRQPAAFVGFDDLTATFFYTRMEDRQIDRWGRGLYREAISEKVGISYR